MASSSSSSTSPIHRSFHDVFLSFSGADTRNTFTSHLLSALNQQGFSTFHDETMLEKGQDIRLQLPNGISESRVSIVIFSKTYAASGWCLDELVKIMECNRDFSQIVLPVFYDVDPSDVRYQKGFYAEAFKKHEDRYKGTSSMEMVRRWREALTQAANLSGWPLENRDEGKLIKTVVNEVTNRLDQLYRDVADRPIGIDSRVQELKEMLNLESNDVTIVAIWGVGGIGKTTIAKALFNSIRNTFEGSSFLPKENLVALELKYSRLNQIWTEPKRMDKLRFLNLSFSYCLTKTPDFSGMKNLEELFLMFCTNLVEVHHSIGCLDKLTILNMFNCKSITKVPSSIFMLTSLQNLCTVVHLPIHKKVWYKIANKTKGTNAYFPRTDMDYVCSWDFEENKERDVMWMSCVGLSENGLTKLEVGDDIEVVIDCHQKGITVKKLGIKLIYEGEEKAPELDDQIIYSVRPGINVALFLMLVRRKFEQ